MFGVKSTKKDVVRPRKPSVGHEARKQGQWEKAVCLVNVPGQYSCTGTLTVCRGLWAVVCSGREKIRGGEARFYCDGSANSIAAALLPDELFAKLGDLIVVAVDTEPLTEMSPIHPSPSKLKSLAQHMSYVGTGPRLDVVSYINATPKTTSTLYLEDVLDDRIFFKKAEIAVGAPVFSETKWIGVVTSATEGIGVAKLLENVALDESQTAFLIPRTLETPFNGRAAVKEIAGSLVFSSADADAIVAVKAVQEANGTELRRLQNYRGPAFLRDLRVANDWTLPCIAAMAHRSAPTLLLLEDLGVDLHRRYRDANTVAHIAAYHGNVPALRLLAARGYDVDRPNDLGLRPVDCASHSTLPWFHRRGIVPSTRNNIDLSFDDEQ